MKYTGTKEDLIKCCEKGEVLIVFSQCGTHLPILCSPQLGGECDFRKDKVNFRSAIFLKDYIIIHGKLTFFFAFSDLSKVTSHIQRRLREMGWLARPNNLQRSRLLGLRRVLRGRAQRSDPNGRGIIFVDRTKARGPIGGQGLGGLNPCWRLLEGKVFGFFDKLNCGHVHTTRGTMKFFEISSGKFA